MHKYALECISIRIQRWKIFKFQTDGTTVNPGEAQKKSPGKDFGEFKLVAKTYICTF